MVASDYMVSVIYFGHLAILGVLRSPINTSSISDSINAKTMADRSPFQDEG